MQYEIYIVSLDPTLGSEIQKTRPCVVISPDQMNEFLRTVQVAPLTSNLRKFPWRIPMIFRHKPGMLALDQIRTVDKQRLLERVGKVSPTTAQRIRAVIHEMLVL